MHTSRPSTTPLFLEGHVRTVQRVLGWFVILGGLVVIGGWFLKNAQLTQLNPQFAPMQFNTALGFIVSGVALLLLIDARGPMKAPVAGVFLIVLGAATLLQYVLGMSFGIDNLVVEPFTAVRTSHPGRMAPNTAIGFVLFGLSCVFVARNKLGVGICLSGGVLALGTISVLGYISGVESAYGWGDLTRMALHTSIGFIVVGGGVVAMLAWPVARPLYNPAFLGLCIGSFGVVCSIAVWQALLADQGSQLRLRLGLHGERIANGMSLRLEETILALERLAERSVEGGSSAEARRRWERDSRRYLDDFDTLSRLYWKNESHWNVWAEDREDGATVAAPTTMMAPIIRDVRSAGFENSVVLHLWEAPERYLSIGIGVTNRQGDRGVLCADLEMRHFVEPLIGRMTGDVELQLYLGERVVYDTTGQYSMEERTVFRTSADVPSQGGVLHLILGANDAFIRDRASGMAWVVLLGGIVITGLLVLAVLFAVVSWRARELYKAQYSEYQLVTDSVPAMIAVLDSAERIIFVNSRLREWLGREWESDPGIRAITNVFGVEYEWLRQHIAMALSGETVRVEMPVTAPGSEDRIVDLQLVPHTGPNGDIDQVFALILDVTAEIEAREELRSTAERLQRFSKLATGRELRMLELKREVNGLLGLLGREERYQAADLSAAAPGAGPHDS